MKKTIRERVKCAKWLYYCIKIKFITKDQLPDLENIYWKFRKMRHGI